MSAAGSDTPVAKKAMSAIWTPEQLAQDVLQIESNSNKMQTFSGSTKPSDRMDTDLSYAEVVKRQGVPFNKKSYDNINTSFKQGDRDGGLNEHYFQGDQVDRTKQQNFQDIKPEPEDRDHTFLFQEKEGQKTNKIKKGKMIFCWTYVQKQQLGLGGDVIVPYKGVEQKITLQSMFVKKIQLAPALQERGLK